MSVVGRDRAALTFLLVGCARVCRDARAHDVYAVCVHAISVDRRPTHAIYNDD